MARKQGIKHTLLQQLKFRRALLALVVLGVFTVSLLVLYKAGTASRPSSSRLFLTSAFTQRCAEKAAAFKPPAAATAAFGFQVRELPPIGASAPVLAASNWEGAANRHHAELTREELTKACGGIIFRYRVVNRVVYADHDHHATDVLAGHRDTFVEMLLTAVWLFQSFPDVDLWVSFADEPSRCSLDVPVLQYALIGLNVTHQAALHNLASEGGSSFSVAQLLTTPDSEPNQDPAPKFYRGWGIGYPFSWENLSLLPDALRAWQRCLLRKVGGRPHVPKLIWRGSNTGSVRGWAPQVGPAVQPLRHPWGIALTSKRMALALLARSHPDIMDVGLHGVHDWLMGPAGQDKQLVADLQRLLVKPYVPMDLWSSYAVQLSIDGHGSPDRLPLQYLQGSSVVLKMVSPYKDWYEERFQPGVHYEPFRYDMSDLVPRLQGILGRFKSGDTRGLEEMAAQAGSMAVDVFSILGQLDALLYAVLKVRSVCDWEVQVPPLRDADAPRQVPGASAAPEWHVLALSRGRAGSTWKAPTLRAPWAASTRLSLLQKLSANLVEKDV